MSRAAANKQNKGPWFICTLVSLLVLRLFSVKCLHCFCQRDVQEFFCLPTGMKEEAMGRTMTLKDDFGVIAWTWRAGNYLSLFLLLSLFSSSALSDVPFPKNQHFSWKTGKSTLLHFQQQPAFMYLISLHSHDFRHFSTKNLNFPFLTFLGVLPLNHPVTKWTQPPKLLKKGGRTFLF